MKLKDIKPLVKIAREAGLLIDELDYGWTVGAYNERLQKGVYISQVFRAERDGYVGGKIITEDTLREWIKENPA